MRRSDIFNDGINAFQRSSFNASKCLKVRFIGEPAVDQGGPRREFFRLFQSEMGQTSGMFHGWPHCLSPVSNSQAVANGRFSTCGKVIAAMILQDCQAPCCFSRPEKKTQNLECIPDREIQEKLKKVCTPDHYWGGREKESISTKDNTALLLHKLNIFTLILYVHR